MERYIVPLLSSPLFSGVVGALSLLIGIWSFVKIHNVEKATAEATNKMLFTKNIDDNYEKIKQARKSLEASKSLKEINHIFASISGALYQIADTNKKLKKQLLAFSNKQRTRFYQESPSEGEFIESKVEILKFLGTFLNEIERNR